MGKKKKRGGPPMAPIFFAKKRRLNEETTLTALLTLHRYSFKFKLGTPGFRLKAEAPPAYHITVVMDGAELGSAKHVEKDAAMERASLLTLNLLDPEGKSIIANISHANEGELKAMQVKIANAKQEAPRADGVLDDLFTIF